jgi:hypothetical protein
MSGAAAPEAEASAFAFVRGRRRFEHVAPEEYSLK